MLYDRSRDSLAAARSAPDVSARRCLHRRRLLRHLTSPTALAAMLVLASAAADVGEDDIFAELGRLEQVFEHKRKRLIVHDLPLFSLGVPWSRMGADEHGLTGLRFFEPRYVWLARRIADAVTGPDVPARFGFAHTYPPQEGSEGTLVEVPSPKTEGMHWLSETTGPVNVLCRRGPRFKILKVRTEVPPNAPDGAQPLFVGEVEVDPEGTVPNDDQSSSSASTGLIVGRSFAEFQCGIASQPGVNDKRQPALVGAAAPWTTWPPLLMASWRCYGRPC
eukprot:gnl/TRDRNA2_/TRDRNA2_148604_c0_seq4.p2 gnl/TRDRNA2_/TRDRNA2_148604_c0~~gnl/TRDRNA2_/TRDRNA2_148604_c0_seq4.p2  ORF type:complete len:303 (+),score=35.58 gnl/TRDRNA2_/TRDRNA2_148604_c0_seq4:79-909(+)